MRIDARARRRLVVLWISLACLTAAGRCPAATPDVPVAVTVQPGTILRESLPQALFGFNINFWHFGEDIVASPGGVEAIVPTLQQLPGALYRYPGGLVANAFSWEDSIGPRAARAPQKVVRWSGPGVATFGVDEYASLVHAAHGMPWYVLNLVGSDADERHHELPVEVVAASNARLAKHLRDSFGDDAGPINYELGNELDRSEYEWSYEKYVARSAATIKAVREVDPQARFVAFLRDFDWKYRRGDRAGQISDSDDFIRAVLRGLPEVNDISFHAYYDDPGLEHRNSKQIPWRIRSIQRAIDTARKERPGTELRVWITEHARGVNLTEPKPGRRAPLTSNLRAAVSVADFLGALAQMPQVQGAAMHGLNARPWEAFDASIRYHDLRPRPTVLALLVLRKMDLPRVVRSTVRGPNVSGYPGGYDVRVTAFTDHDGKRLGFWVTNRAEVAESLEISDRDWGGRAIELRTYSISADAHVDPDRASNARTHLRLDPLRSRGAFTSDGILELPVEPMSVSTILIDRADP